MKTKAFDCVEMKWRGGHRVYERIKNMTPCRSWPTGGGGVPAWRGGSGRPVHNRQGPRGGREVIAYPKGGGRLLRGRPDPGHSPGTILVVSGGG